MDRVINAGLVAYGMSGRVFHAPFLHTLPGFRLKSVVERHHQEARQRYPDVTTVRSLEALLADEDIELVVITTPNHLHFDDARRALTAGRHVVVEKPFVETVAQAEELIALARAQKRHLMVYQNRRWDGDFLTVRQVIDQRMLGDLLHYEAHFDRYVNYIRPGNTWKEQTQGATGVLYDLGAHLIDQTLQLFGMPRYLTADLRVERPDSQIHDSFYLTLDYGRPRVTLRAGFLVRTPGPRFTLHGTEGSFLKWGIDGQEAALKAGAWPNAPQWGQEDEAHWGHLHTHWGGLDVRGRVATLPGNYNRFYEMVYDCLTHDAPPPVAAAEALLTQKVIEAAHVSSRERRTVAFI